jgi:hypothetical protein
MDIKLWRIGLPAGGPPLDYSTFISWEADRSNPARGNAFNVGVLHDDIEQAYLSFRESSQRSEFTPQFVLMDQTGVVLASRIAGRFHEVHVSFPPEQPSPYSTVSGMDTVPIIGSAGERNLDPPAESLLLEDIARTYIHQRLDEYDQSVKRSEVHILFTTTYESLARLICDNPSLLDDVEWRELEKLLQEVLSGVGYIVTLTPGSKDGGKDLILECSPMSGSVTYFVEVKHWRSEQKVGAKTIKAFYKVVVREKTHGGLFLSTYGIADNALEQLTEVERRMIRVGTQSKVVALCKSYVRSKSGVFLPSTELPVYLFSDTLG